MTDPKGRDLFWIVRDGEPIAAARTIHDVADATRSLDPATYQIEEVINASRRDARRVSRFWGWVTHGWDGIVSVEPCLSVLEG
jgi:hypothetical protein